MIKKSLYLLPFIVSAFANAENGVYTSLYSGATFSSNNKYSDDNGFSEKMNLKASPVFGAAVGYNYQDLSFEISYDTRSSKRKDSLGEYKSNILLVNAIYNFNVASDNIKPYVGLGLGLGQSEAEFTDSQTVADLKADGVGAKYKLKNAFAMQLKGGAKVYLTPSIAVFGDLRYTSLAKVGYKNSSDASIAYDANGSKDQFNYFSANVGVSYFF